MAPLQLDQPSLQGTDRGARAGAGSLCADRSAGALGQPGARRALEGGR